MTTHYKRDAFLFLFAYLIHLLVLAQWHENPVVTYYVGTIFGAGCAWWLARAHFAPVETDEKESVDL
jgi:hypothetical protein